MEKSVLDLQRSVQAVLRELGAQAPALQSNQGMWRWSLHKKVERDPGKSPALVRILLRELEKAESEDIRHAIIPLLHTLMYVLTKATGITEELYRRTYTFCTRLLTLPAPYCTVALDCAIRLKTETAVPGTLYQRLVIAEQNLTSELYPYQESLEGGNPGSHHKENPTAPPLLSGDPLQSPQPNIPLPSPHITFHLWTDEEQLWKELVLFLRPRSQLCLSADLEALDLQGFWPDRELARVSMLSTDSGIERDLPPGAGQGHCAHQLGALRPGEPSSHHTAPILQMRKRVKRETQKCCLTPRLSLQLYYIPVLAPEKQASCRHSELRELATFLGRADPWYESTVNTLCPAIHKLAEMPPSLDTSRTVDPFILDVITYYLRMGTQPIYFQIYTVKIFRDLSQHPAEDIFLTELKVKIQDTKPPKDGFSPRRRGAAEGPGAELNICYQKALLSHRAQEVAVSLRTTGLVLKTFAASDTEVSGPAPAPPPAVPVTDHTCLNVSVTEVIKSSNLAGRSFSMVTNTFRTANIQIQSQDQRLLTLLLDKDSRRTFKDVVRFEVSPCPEPCSGAHKSEASQLGSHGQEVEGTKAKPKPLLMPINTFSGIVQ
uniref:Phosphoinositide-3-kinase regulatory subunit 6 n=1 Tax=Panthera tigris altaica TaxID=74533 RepID=A0A8C9JW65_PANTA